MKRLLRILMPVAALTAIACAPPPPQNSTEVAARSDVWEVAFNAGDLDKIAGLYTENARLMPPNTEMVRGREAVKKIFGEMHSAGLKGELTTVEAMSAGDLGYHVGTYKVMTAEGAEADRGKFMETWRRVGGEWLMENDIWNSDLPAVATVGTDLIVTHDVKDTDRWLAAWRGPDSRHEMFAGHGVASSRTFLDTADPKHVAVLLNVTDMDAFMAVMQSPEGDQAKAEDGVITETLRLFKEAE